MVDQSLNENYIQKMMYLKRSKDNLIEDAKQKDGIDNVDLQELQQKVI